MLSTWVITVLAAGLLSAVALGLYHRHDGWGIAPLLFLLTALGLAIPVTVGIAPIDHEPLGAANQAQAVGVPVLIASILLLYMLAGRRNAISAAVLPAAAGLLVAALLVAWSGAGRSPILALAPAAPTGVAMAGAAVSLGAVAALGVFELLGRVPWARLLVRGIPAGLAGVAVYGVVVTVAWTVGLDAGFAAWPSSVAVPLVAALLPVSLVALYADHRTAGLGGHAWQALLEQPAFGARSGLDQVGHRGGRHAQGLREGQSLAGEQIQLLDDQPVAAFICRSHGSITYANRAMARLVDRQGESLLGRNILDLLGDKDRRGRPRFASDVLEPGRHRLQLTTAKGTVRLVEVRVALGEDGHRLGHIIDLGPPVGSNGDGHGPHQPAVELTDGGGEPGRIP